MNRAQSRGEQTRSRVLDRIRASSQISRVELATATGLTQAAISTIIRQAIDAGLVVEVGYGQSTGGKRRTMLALDRAARHALGVSLDSERVTYVVTDLTGQLVSRLSSTGLGGQDPEAATGQMAEALRALVQLSGIRPSSIAGVGVASPGPLNSRAGMLQGSQPSPAWHGFALRSRLEAYIGLPVVVDNDASCAALGEFWTGRGSTIPAVSACVYMADGIGSGILIDGQVFHGSSSNTGEIGHISLDIDGPECRCGARGCVEVYAAPRAVVANAMHNHSLSARLELSGQPNSTRIEFARLIRAASRGAPDALDLVVTAARRLGQGITALANVLDLEEVSLSGPGYDTGGAIFARTIQQELAQRAFVRSIHPVRVRLSQIGTEAAALGAAAMVLQQDLAPMGSQAVGQDVLQTSPASIDSPKIGGVVPLGRQQWW